MDKEPIQEPTSTGSGHRLSDFRWILEHAGYQVPADATDELIEILWTDLKAKLNPENITIPSEILSPLNFGPERENAVAYEKMYREKYGRSATEASYEDALKIASGEINYEDLPPVRQGWVAKYNGWVIGLG